MYGMATEENDLIDQNHCADHKQWDNQNYTQEDHI
jgi:hypothetical protein